MSHQGNIRVVNEDGDVFLLTSGRWNGGETPVAAREALRWAYSGDEGTPFDSQEFMQELLKNPSVSHPIKSIGNADVPVVEVDFRTQQVNWCDDPKDGHGKRIHLNMDFNSYIESGFDCIKAGDLAATTYQERFNQ